MWLDKLPSKTHFLTPGVTYKTRADFVHLGLHYTTYLKQDFSCHVALEALQNSLIISGTEKRLNKTTVLLRENYIKIKIKFGGNKSVTPHCPQEEI